MQTIEGYNRVSRDKFWAYVTVFGTLWGGVELTLGTFLHVLHVPKTGLIMTAITIIILIAQRRLFPHRGSTLAVAVVAACLKSLSPGGIIAGPIFGILSEAAIIELCLLPSSRFFTMILAGGLTLVWSQLQSLVKTWIYYGQDFIEGLCKLITKFFAISWTTAIGVGLIALYFALIFVIGIVAAIIGCKLGQNVEKQVCELDAVAVRASESEESKASQGEIAGEETENSPAMTMKLMSEIRSGHSRKRAADEQTIRTRLAVLPFAILTLIAQFPDIPWATTVALVVWLITLGLGTHNVLKSIWWPRFWLVSAVVCVLSGLILAWSPGEAWNWTLGLEATARMLIRGIYIFSLITWATRCVRSEEFLTLWRKIHLPELGDALTHAYKILPEWLDRLNEMLKNAPRGFKPRLHYIHACILESLVEAIRQAEGVDDLRSEKQDA